ncbi:MAG: DUF1450 domain-containing protein [Firmicutes bacterium]|nr:DUF1450 domain-containing protein [Bacillota bacterium]
MNKLGVCDKCKAVDYKSIIDRVKKLDPSIEINIGCQNICGIGRTKPFVILNHKPVIGNNEEDLLKKISMLLK